MRLATIVGSKGLQVAAIADGRCLPLDPPVLGRRAMHELASLDDSGLTVLRDWITEQPADAWNPLEGVEFGPAVPEPGAIYTIGLNYRPGPGPDPDRPPRPLVYGKLPSSVAAHGATLSWDRELTPNVDAEVELGVVIGADGSVFGYTIVNDVSSRDEWLDGDQWLLGKSMAGFCPVGPIVVTADEIDPAVLHLGCTIDGVAIQDGSTADMRFSIAEIVAFLARHVALRPGDLIATGTPARLGKPPGPDRHLQPGDVVTCWIEGIGALRTPVA
jgi:2-keto-4-pentenoate hydratase/2-oxohepta-3-ene-1,7-dioic acid hydratase in catechol pathway